MSNTIDERVVKMQFDNASFEKNVQTSLGTLAKLKDALHFDKVDMSGIASNIEKITDKVTSMGGVWDNICQRMINKAVDVGQSIAQNFVFNPPTDGFKEYELKMDSLKVIMESSHESLDTVNKYLNELNTYSDKTIYSFSDMTASIGKFTNAGVDLDTSVKAIQGIANEAALAGASTQQASHAMYNFAQALSAGSVKLIDWKSIENANMATKDFKEELIKTAVELGTLKKSGDDYISTTTNMQGKTSEAFNATKGFNDSLQAQWMTTDVLTTTLGRYADETTDIGARASKAATEVRTFSAMMDALKEAVGSGWAQTWEIIFGNMEEATEMWTSINDVLSGFIGKFSDARNAVLQDWKDLGGRKALLEGLANVFHILGNVIQPIKDAITLVFPPLTGKTLADITNKFAEFTGKIKEATEFFPMKLFGAKEEKELKGVKKGADESADSVKKLGKEVKETADKAEKDWSKIREAAKKVINGDFGNDSAREDALKKAGFDPDEIQAYVNKVHELSNGTWDLSDKTLDAAEKSLGAVEKTEKAAEKTTKTAKKTTEATDDVAKSVDKATEAYNKAESNAQRTMNAWYDKTVDITEAGNLLTFSLANAMSGVVNIFKSAGKVIGVFGKAWKDSFSGVEITMGNLVAFDEAMRNFADKMKISEGALDNFYDIFKEVFTLVKTVRDNVVNLVVSILPTVLNIISSIIDSGGKVLRFLSSAIGLIANLVKRSNIIRIAFDALSFVIKEVGSAFSFVIKVIGYFGGLLSKAISYVGISIEHFHIMALVGIRLRYAFDNIVQAYTKLKNKLAEKLGFKSFDEFTKKADKVVEKIKGFLVPAFTGFIDFLRNLLSGKSISFDIFKGLKGGLSIFDGLLDFAKEKAIGAKFIAFYEVLKSKFGNIVEDFKNIFFKKKGVAGFLDKLIPFKKEQTFSEKVLAFYKSVTKNLKEAFDSFRTIFFGKQNKFKTKEGIIGAAIPLSKEKESVSKIINFFNKARELIHNAISSLFSKISGKSEKTPELLQLKAINKNAEKPLDRFVEMLKNVKNKVSKVNIKETLKNAFTFFKDKAIPSAIEYVCDLFGKFEMFVAKLDFKKVLLAAKTARTIVKIFNDIKLAKSFSGMADSIGGFFDNLGGQFGKKEESKATSFLKIAASLALVAKAISLIASIPEDRLDSSVGVVAGIALVMTAIVIAFEKIKPKEGSDINGATKAALAMAVSLYIIAKAICNVASLPPERVGTAGEVIFATVAVLTAATFALSKMKTVGKSTALAPIGFAIALKLLADTVAKLGTIPEKQIKQGEKNIWKIGLALTMAMFAIGRGNYNYASVLAPLAFAIGVCMIANKMVMLSLIPTRKLIKGGIVIKFLENLLKSAMKGLEGVDVKVVLAPLAFAAGIYLLGKTMAKLGKLDIGTLLKGGGAVAALGVILVACMNLLRKATDGTTIDKSILAGLIVISGSILILGFAVAKLGKLKVGQLFKGVIAVGALGAVLAGIMYLLSTYTAPIDKSVLASMLVTTGMIVVLASTAALVGLVPFWNLLKGVLVIGAVGAILVLATSFLDNVKLNPSAIFGLVVMTISLVVLAETAAIIGILPLPVLAKGVAVILLLGVMLAAASAVLSAAKVSPATLAAPIVMVLAIVLLAMTAVSIGMIPLVILRKGLSVVVILGLLLAIIASELGKAKIEVTDIVALIAIVVGIQLLAMTVLSLGVLPLDVLGKGLGVVTILSLLLTKAVEALGKGNFSVVDVLAPLIIVAAVLALAMAVRQLGSLDIGTLAKGLVAVGLILGGLVLALRELSVIMPQLMLISSAVPGLIAFAAVVAILALVAKQLGSLDNGTYGKGLAGIIVLIGGLVVAFKLLASVSGEMIMIGAAFILFGIGASLLGDAFIKVATGMVIFTQALLMFTMLKTEEQFTGLAVGIGVLAGVLFLFIGIIVGFVAALYVMPGLIPPLLAFSVALLMIGTGLYLLVSAIEKFIAIAGQIGGALAAAISSIAANAGAIFESIKNAVLGAINYIVDNAPAFFEKAGAMISSAVAGIQEKAPEIKAKVGEAVSKAIEWIKNHFPAWVEAGKNLLSKVINGIKEYGPKVLAKIAEFIGNALHWIIEHLPEWLEAGKNLLSKIIEGIGNLAGDLKDKAAEVISDAKDAVLDKLDDWISAGKDLIGGLIQGIKDKASDLISAAKGVVDDAIQAAKNLLQINSPSKVFRSMGYSIDEGLIVGMRGMADKVTAASEFVTEGVIKSAKKPLDQLADLLSSDIVDDPTITPVLDLSQIQNGANKLYSMLSDADRVSFSGNVDLANAASLSVSRDQRRKQESDNQMMGSLIDAINGLSSLIGNTGNIYNVNGVTYDDGSNVSSAVRSLIRAAKIEGRA